jgi:hypothetical protein
MPAGFAGGSLCGIFLAESPNFMLSLPVFSTRIRVAVRLQRKSFGVVKGSFLPGNEIFNRIVPADG